MKIYDLIGALIAYIALVVVTCCCVFGWASYTADDNSRAARQACDCTESKSTTYISPADKALIEIMEHKDE